MVNREKYLKELISYKDTDIIKVVTGIRRCGKSTLFTIYQKYLIENCNINKNQIISINLEDLEYSNINNYMDLYNYINSKIDKNKKYYIFIDEAQNIQEYEKAVDSIYIKENCDVYITGSNAYLLSSELSTLLSGRYIEIKMLPFSINEYSKYLKLTRSEYTNYGIYQKYIKNSGFPYTLQLAEYDNIRSYLESLIDTIIVKDIITRKEFSNTSLFKSVFAFLLDNIGNIVSANKIANTLISTGRKASVNTIDSYLLSLTESFVMYKVNRYDIKGKEYLKNSSKYYVSDVRS